MSAAFRFAAVAVLLLASACSSSNEGGSSAPVPTQCNKANRVGTYKLSWTVESGDCPALPDQLVSFNESDGKANAGTGCQIHSDVWSAGDCKNERTITCVSRVSDPSQYGGYGSVTNDAVAVTRQTTQDGSRIEGTISSAITTSGGASCRSIYGVTYVRQ